jgi:hypothetical protein
MIRMLSLLAASAMVVSFAALPASAQQTQPAAKPAMPEMAAMTVQQIAPALYLVKGGSGANTAFYIGAKLVVAVDAKMSADAARQMIAEIAKITPNPLAILILTHSDGDHVNGLAGFPPGLTILASEGTRREMEEAFKDEKMAGLRAYLPTQTYGLDMQLRIPMSDGGLSLVSLILAATLWSSSPTRRPPSSAIWPSPAAIP